MQKINKIKSKGEERENVKEDADLDYLVKI